MSITILTNFIEITTAAGGDAAFDPNCFQNGFVDGNNTPITNPLTNKKHQFLSFMYQGAARNRSGDNMESALLLANNAISMNYAKTAVDLKYHIKVETYVMKSEPDQTPSLVPTTLLASEVWLATSLTYDPVNIEIVLSSSIDAVGANAPNRVLTTRQVSHLPITGSIQTR
tara:strand:+ start:3430 stop:3942 length:513 start_codon:yes stop_codon:yes gene_type:complete